MQPLRTVLGTVTAGLLFAALAILPAGAGAADDGDCKIATDPTTEVGKACKEGGIKRAKAVMKAMTKQAKKELKVDCDSCHKNEDDWTLTGDARDKYKEMLKIVGKEK